MENALFVKISILEFVVIILLMIILLLSRKNGRLKTINSIDQLTGIHNYYFLNGKLDEEMKRSLRFKRPFRVLFMDIDNFKAVNDNFGHEAGDMLLVKTADALKEILKRNTDIFGRWYKGDEFLIILPESTIEETQLIAKRIAEEIELVAGEIIGDDILTDDKGEEVKISASIGIVSFDPNELGNKILTKTELIKKADAEMYKAKKIKKCA